MMRSLLVFFVVGLSLTVIGCQGRDVIVGFDAGDYRPDAPGAPDAPSFTESGIGRTDLAIDRVVPGHGPFVGGNIAILRGAGFTADSTVHFGEHSVQPADHVLIDSRRLQVRVPAGEVGTVDVSVTEAGETFTLPDGYTYDAISVEPDSGSIAGNTVITITGSGTSFAAGDTVRVGRGECQDVVVASPVSITCRTPAAAAGTVDVIVRRASDGSETIAEDAYSYYDSADPIGGGLGGGELSGSLNVTVLNWITGAPVPDVFAIVGDDLSTEHQGLTNAMGQITFSGADLVGPQTIHLSKTCFERTSFVAFNATDVTAFIIPWQDPACGMGSGGGGGRGRLAAFIEGQLVWRGPNEYGPNPWDNIPEPREGWRRVAYVFTTVADPDAAVVDPGLGGSSPIVYEVVPDGEGWIGYPYRIAARPAGLAVYAIAGLELPAAPPERPDSRFVPYVMGVARNVLAGPGETETDVNIIMDIPLDHYIEAMIGARPPTVNGDPDHFRFQAFMDLGGEGFIVRTINGTSFDTVRRVDASAPIRFVGEPALLGSLEDGRYRIRGGWYSGNTYEGQPSTTITMNGVSAVDELVALPDFLGIPNPTAPTDGDFFPADRIIRWELGGDVEADYQMLTIFGSDLNPQWRVFLPGDVREVEMPDLSSIENIEDMPPGDLYWDITAVRVPGLSFDEFRYTYLNQRYWTHSSYNQFTSVL